MIIFVILTITALFIALLGIAGIIATWIKMANPENDILFGATLPKEEFGSQNVTVLKREFKKLCKTTILWIIISFLPTFYFLFIIKIVTFTFTYLIIWFLAILVVGARYPYNIIHKKLAKIKRENGWFVGTLHEVTIDTFASNQKNDKIIPAWLLLFPTTISVIALSVGIINHANIAFIISAIADVFIKAVILWVYYVFKHQPAKAFSENSEVNVAFNVKRQRLWSAFWVAIAFIDSIAFVTSWLFFRIPSYGAMLFSFVIITAATITLFLLLHTDRKIKEVQNLYESNNSHPIMTDDDVYWERGFYYNPNDNNWMVPKRNGYGMTTNMATRKGKIFLGAMTGIGVLTVIVVFAIIFSQVLPYEIIAPQLKISNQRIYISDLSYSTNFPISEVRTISLIDNLPTATKLNGNNGIYYSGEFNVGKYGISHMYLDTQVSPFIVIRLKNSTVFYNERSKEKTLEIYRKLEKST